MRIGEEWLTGPTKRVRFQKFSVCTIWIFKIFWVKNWSSELLKHLKLNCQDQYYDLWRGSSVLAKALLRRIFWIWVYWVKKVHKNITSEPTRVSWFMIGFILQDQVTYHLFLNSDFTRVLWKTLNVPIFKQGDNRGHRALHWMAVDVFLDSWRS